MLERPSTTGPDHHKGGADLLRPVGTADLEALRAVERAAGEPFRSIGMVEIADDEPPPAEVLRVAVDRGQAWLVERPGTGVIAFLLAADVDGCGHLEQVSVVPAVRGERVGRRLIEHCAGASRARGRPALTLTTFADVVWNAPWYRRLGFRVVGDADLSPGLRAIREAERARGLDRWPRVAMRRDLR